MAVARYFLSFSYDLLICSGLLLSSLEGEPAAGCAVSSGLSIPAPSSTVAAAAGALWKNVTAMSALFTFEQRFYSIEKRVETLVAHPLPMTFPLTSRTSFVAVDV